MEVNYKYQLSTDLLGQTYSERPDDSVIDTLIIHGTRSDFNTTLKYFNGAREASAHYLIDVCGKIYKIVDEDYRAFHAGLSFWGNSSKPLDLNSSSIGIELVNPLDKEDFPDYPAPQIDSLAFLVDKISSEHPIYEHNVIGHSEISLGRKNDPGINFPWERIINLSESLEYHGVYSDKPSVLDLKNMGYLCEADQLVNLPDHYKSKIYFNNVLHNDPKHLIEHAEQEFKNKFFRQMEESVLLQRAM